MQSVLEFARRLSTENLTQVDRAVALVWFHSLEDASHGVPAGQTIDELEAAGYAKQNRTRLTKRLEDDRRTRQVGRDALGITLRARPELDQLLTPFLGGPLPKASDSVLPRTLFGNSRGYIERVVHQINASYDAGLYDCTAVMCRRLLETLIIEVYERSGREAALKGPDGHCRMLSGLLNVLESDGSVTLGRESVKALKAFKLLGDQAAHNRRFNAHRDDIDRVRDGIRLAAEDLLHLAGMDPRA